jgi:phage terminase large subunit-like protein
MGNAIFEYYQKIKDGSIIAGKWINLWYEYIVDGLEKKLFFFDQKAANHVIQFVEQYCRHHEGSLAPNLLKLELWQKAFLSVVFGIKDAEGNRQFREVVLLVGRKNGKTLLAAAIAAYCAYKDGEYGGRIYFTAPKLQQATLCYDAFYQMIRKEPLLDKRAKKRRTDVYIEATNTSAAPLAFSVRKSDGLNISCCIADEVASWVGDPGLKFYEVLKSSFGSRRQPLLISITTAGYVDGGIYDELIRRSTRVLYGDATETRLAPFLYMIDDVGAWSDINELAKANPNLGVSITVDYLLEEIRIAEGSLSKEHEVLTKYANIKQNSSLAWLSAQTVEAACGDELKLEDFSDSYAVAGIDLSQTRDLTACTVVIERDGELHVFAKFFLPSERIDEATQRDGIPYNIYIQRGLLKPSGDNYIDYNDCFEWFRMLVEDYRIYPLITGYDRYSAQYLIQKMRSYGFVMDDVFQGENLYPVILETEGLLEDRKIHIGNNDLLKIHLLNSAIKMSNERGRGKLVKINPTQHIDGCAALLDAMTVRQKWYMEYGERLKNRGGTDGFV